MDRAEACGRCGVTSVVDAAGEDAEGDGGRNPFDGPRIELPADELQRGAFVAVRLGRVKRRLDAAARAVIYGR